MKMLQTRDLSGYLHILILSFLPLAFLFIHILSNNNILTCNNNDNSLTSFVSSI